MLKKLTQAVRRKAGHITGRRQVAWFARNNMQARVTEHCDPVGIKEYLIDLSWLGPDGLWVHFGVLRGKRLDEQLDVLRQATDHLAKLTAKR